MTAPRPIRRVLVAKLMFIGDVVLATPVLEAIKRGLPGVSVMAAVPAGMEDVLRGNPFVDDVCPVPVRGGWRAQLGVIRRLRAGRFDLLLDLTDSDRSAVLGRLSGARFRIGFDTLGRWRRRLYHQVVRAPRGQIHEVEYNLEMVRAVGCPVAHGGPRVYPSAADAEFIDRLLAGHGVGRADPIALLHAGARRWFKGWPAERFAALARRLHAAFGVRAVVVGSAAEAETAGELAAACGSWAVSVAGRTGILQLAALARRARLFVGNDSGPMHVAAAAGAPVVALFGPTCPVAWGPWGGHHVVVRKPSDCSPCWRDDCRRGEMNCMRQITVDDASDAVTTVLARTARRAAA